MSPDPSNCSVKICTPTSRIMPFWLIPSCPELFCSVFRIVGLYRLSAHLFPRGITPALFIFPFGRTALELDPGF